MPLCTRPGQTWNYTFPCDRELPESKRPMVICKALSQRDGEKYLSEVIACKDIDTADAKIAEALVGVVEMGDIKDVPTMLRRLTQTEREDLVIHVSRGLLTEGQRKN